MNFIYASTTYLSTARKLPSPLFLSPRELWWWWWLPTSIESWQSLSVCELWRRWWWNRLPLPPFMHRLHPLSLWVLLCMKKHTSQDVALLLEAFAFSCMLFALATQFSPNFSLPKWPVHMHSIPTFPKLFRPPCAHSVWPSHSRKWIFNFPGLPLIPVKILGHP